jgi:hypothetical protein
MCMIICHLVIFNFHNFQTCVGVHVFNMALDNMDNTHIND